MDFTLTKPPSEMIWEDDWNQLRDALEFYAELQVRTGAEGWEALQSVLEGRPPASFAGADAALWPRCVAAHRGFQLGLELLLLIPRLGLRSGFLEVGVDGALEPVFPERFRPGSDSSEVEHLTRLLAPPPKASPNEIVAPSGGAFYGREAPHLPLLVDVGEHFEAGQPLFVIEVMKMFNKVLAPCAGTVLENRMKDADGAIVKAGQTIFRIEPDEVLEEESLDGIRERQRKLTLSLLA